MGHLKHFIYLVLIIYVENCHSALVVEEELGTNAELKQTGDKYLKHNNITSLTATEKESLLAILEKHYKANENLNFETFFELLIKFLASSVSHKTEDSNTPVDTEKAPGGWSSTSNTQGHCSSVGKSCSSGGRESENEEEETEDSKAGGWGAAPGSGWGGSGGKCCNSDFCVHGKCCIPTPSRTYNSRCRNNGDCCNGGLCDNGRCLKPRGQACTDSYECYQSDCVNGICCVPACSNATSSNQSQCKTSSDCCGPSVCDISSESCKSLLGDPCTSTCPSPCYGTTLQCAGNSGKCCYLDDAAGCTKDSDCCYASAGSECKGSPRKCKIGASGSGMGCDEFQFQGVDF